MEVTIRSSKVMLEGLLWSPADNGSQAPASLGWAAVVCHPHPQYGGTMHNKVVFRAARALQSAGLPVLRFNFRGVGKSTGAFDYGHGEQDDVRAALDFVQERYPRARILIAGYSFGSWVGLQVGCQDPRVHGLIGIGTPVGASDFSFLVDCSKPKLFLHGTHDEFGSVDQIEALLLSVPEPKDLVFIEGADHFFNSKLEIFSQSLMEHLSRLLKDRAASRQ